jgi:hypothetical protein
MAAQVMHLLPQLKVLFTSGYMQNAIVHAAGSIRAAEPLRILLVDDDANLAEAIDEQRSGGPRGFDD